MPSRHGQPRAPRSAPRKLEELRHGRTVRRSRCRPLATAERRGVEGGRAGLRPHLGQRARRPRRQVNVVSPGPADTPLFDIPGEQAEAAKAAVAAGLPVKRLARPDEIAAAVVFLASSQSSFVYGVNLYVDGGMNQV